jgi:tetratricopeptide (TPR) repeat protein
MTSRLSNKVLLLLCLVSWLGIGERSACADEFSDHYNRGMQLYEGKSYDEAVTELQKAYEIRQLPRLLLNIGTVYRKMGKAREALSYYELYLKAEPNPPRKIRKDLDEFIPQTRALLEKPSGKDGQPQPGGTTGPNGQASATDPTAKPPTAGPAETPIYKKPWFWGIVGGAAAVVLIAGIAGGVVAEQRKIPGDIQIIQLQLRF